MARITKDPDERRSEIIEAAENLFSIKGFENTAISDIVKSIGVAQGTFYYYFRSKEDVFNAVIEHYVDEVIDSVRLIAEDDGIGLLDKFKRIIDEGFKMQATREKLIIYLHNEESSVIHEKITRKIIERFTPILAIIIRQGIGGGVFRTEYPEETAEFLMMGSFWLGDVSKLLQNRQQYIRRVMALEDIVSKLLEIDKKALGDIRMYLCSKGLVFLAGK